nr:MAG: VP3 protein [Drosophila Glencorse burn reovirus]
MAFRIMVRSVKASNRPASIRPDSVDMYVQLDIYHDHLTAETGTWTKQVARCKQNVKIIAERNDDTAIWVANPFKIIRDIVLCDTDGMEDDDYQSLEDGRSRRYFIRSAVFAHMISVPIESSFIPMTFCAYRTSVNTGNFRVMQLRTLCKGVNIIELIICCVGGKNLADYGKVTIEQYKNDLASFMGLAERSIVDLNAWVKHTPKTRAYVILLMKDHCAPIEAHDPQKFFMSNTRKWHIPPITSSAVEAASNAGWWDIYGWYSNVKEIKVDMTLLDWDDHSPCIYDIRTPYQMSNISSERESAREYYIDRPWKETVKGRKHSGETVQLF